MKRLLITLFAVVLTSFMWANTLNDSTCRPPECYWGQNWFVELSVGAEVLFAPDASLRPFGRRISPGVSIAAGKWFTPFIAARLQIQGYQMFGARTADGIYLNNPINNNTLFGNDDPVRDHVTVYPSGNYFTTYYYQNTHLDLMVSVMRLIYGGVTEKDHWDLIPSVGMGYMTIFPSKGTLVNHLFTSNFGLQGKYCIDNEWSVNLNLQYALFSADFDSRYDGKKYAGNLNLSAGVTYTIFGQNFNKQV